jgi:hypothetical protein
MRMSHWLVSAAGALALGVLAMPVQAAPVGALTGNAAAQQGTSAAEQVNYRCYWRYGRRHCHSYYYGPGVSFYWGGRRHHHHRRHG